MSGLLRQYSYSSALSIYVRSPLPIVSSQYSPNPSCSLSPELYGFLGVRLVTKTSISLGWRRIISDAGALATSAAMLTIFCHPLSRLSGMSGLMEEVMGIANSSPSVVFIWMYLGMKLLFLKLILRSVTNPLGSLYSSLLLFFPYRQVVCHFKTC